MPGNTHIEPPTHTHTHTHAHTHSFKVNSRTRCCLIKPSHCTTQTLQLSLFISSQPFPLLFSLSPSYSLCISPLLSTPPNNQHSPANDKLLITIAIWNSRWLRSMTDDRVIALFSHTYIYPADMRYVWHLVWPWIGIMSCLCIMRATNAASCLEEGRQDWREELNAERGLLWLFHCHDGRGWQLTGHQDAVEAL